MFVPMYISSIKEEFFTKTYKFFLKEINGSKNIPIWIGYLEAELITCKLIDMDLPRPLTHDLLITILN